MKFLDLFAGVGGVRLGMQQAGHECIGYVEIDKYARKSYQAIHDTEGEWTAHDITTVTDDDIRSLRDRGQIDVICGGFPCQSFSVAGKRGGFDDTRGTLFFEIARIAKQIKPRILLLENVKGLVGHDKGKTLDTIVKTLNDIGYRVDFQVLNSKFFGVPQNRERIFIVAIREDLVANEPWRIDAKNKTVVPKGKRRISGYDDVKTFNFDWPAQKEVTTRLRDVLEAKVDEKYYLSEEKTAALVAQLEGVNTPQVLSPQRTEYGKQVRKAYEAGEVEESRHNMRVMRPREDDVSNTLTTVLKDNHLVEPRMVGHVDIKGHDAIKRVYSAEGVSPTVTTMGGGHREPKITEEVRPVLSPEYTSKSQNGRRFKDDGDEMFTLTTQDRHGVAIKKTCIDDTQGFDGVRLYDDETPSLRSPRSGLKVAEPRYRIRKLTPKECWRLQGFPNWAFHKAAEVNSNSQLYKQAGNSVTVNVVYEIAKKL